MPKPIEQFNSFENLILDAYTDMERSFTDEDYNILENIQPAFILLSDYESPSFTPIINFSIVSLTAMLFSDNITSNIIKNISFIGVTLFLKFILSIDTVEKYTTFITYLSDFMIKREEKLTRLIDRDNQDEYNTFEQIIVHSYDKIKSISSKFSSIERISGAIRLLKDKGIIDKNLDSIIKFIIVSFTANLFSTKYVVHTELKRLCLEGGKLFAECFDSDIFIKLITYLNKNARIFGDKLPKTSQHFINDQQTEAVYGTVNRSSRNIFLKPHNGGSGKSIRKNRKRTQNNKTKKTRKSRK